MCHLPYLINTSVLLTEYYIISGSFFLLLHRFFSCLFAVYLSILILLRLDNLYPEHIDRVHIRTTEHYSSRLISRDGSTISKNIHIWKCHMHGHGTELPSLSIKIVAVTYLMPPVAAVRPLRSMSVILICGLLIPLSPLCTVQEGFPCTCQHCPCSRL